MIQPLYPSYKESGFNLSAVVLLAILAAFLLSGCCQRVYPVQNIVHDTVTVTKQVRLRDTVIKVPGAGVSTLIEFTQRTQRLDAKDSLKSVIRDLSNKQAHLTVSQTSKGLTIDCNCDTMAIRAQLRDSLIKVDHRKQEVKTVVMEKKFVPGVVKVLAWTGGLALLVLGIGIVKKIWF